MNGTRIALSPWAREKFDQDRLAELDAKAERLGVKVSTLKRAGKHGLWIASAWSRTLSARFVAGTPQDAIVGALAAYEALVYTSDELATVQAQTGRVA